MGLTSHELYKEDKMKFSVYVFSFLLVSCNLVSKNTEEKETVTKRQVASLRSSLPSSSSKFQFKIPNQVSHAVLFRNKKPVCSFSAIKHPNLIPSHFDLVSSKDPTSLPECNKTDKNLAFNLAQKAVFVDDKGYQTAAIQVAPLALCVAGATMGAYLAFEHASDRVSKQQEPKLMLDSAIAMGGVLLYPLGQAIFDIRSRILKNTGIVGMCGLGTASAIFFVKGLLEAGEDIRQWNRRNRPKEWPKGW